MARSMFISGKHPRHLSPAKWYFGVTCKSCGKQVAILEDTEKGRRAFDTGETLVRTVCPHCGADAETYRSDEVRSFQPLIGRLAVRMRHTPGVAHPREEHPRRRPSLPDRQVLRAQAVKFLQQQLDVIPCERYHENEQAQRARYEDDQENGVNQIHRRSVFSAAAAATRRDRFQQQASS